MHSDHVCDGDSTVAIRCVRVIGFHLFRYMVTLLFVQMFGIRNGFPGFVAGDIKPIGWKVSDT